MARPALMSSIELLLEGRLAEAAIGVEEALSVLAPVEIDIEDRLHRIDDALGREGRADDVADAGILVGAAAEGHLIELLAFFVDAENADMADVMMAAGIDAAGNLDAELADLPLRRPGPVAAGDRHARHLYTILVDESVCGWSRDNLQGALREDGIATSVHFAALHLHSYYATRFGFHRGMFPNAEMISDSTLSLPLSSAMSDEAVDRVVEALHALVV